MLAESAKRASSRDVQVARRKLRVGFAPNAIPRVEGIVEKETVALNPDGGGEHGKGSTHQRRR